MNFCKNALWCIPRILEDFPGGSVVKNPHAKAGDIRDLGSIPGLGRSPGGGNGNFSCILGWKIPWGCKRVRHILATTQQQPQNFRTKGFCFFFNI